MDTSISSIQLLSLVQKILMEFFSSITWKANWSNSFLRQWNCWNMKRKKRMLKKMIDEVGLCTNTKARICKSGSIRSYKCIQKTDTDKYQLKIKQLTNLFLQYASSLLAVFFFYPSFLISRDSAKWFIRSSKFFYCNDDVKLDVLWKRYTICDQLFCTYPVWRHVSA